MELTPYYMLECFAPGGEEFTDILEYPLLSGVESWMTGSRFSRPLPEPIQLQWDPDTRGPQKTLYDVTIPLFRAPLLAALRAAGVDNLDSYRTEIRDPRSGRTSRDYFAVNVIGTVAAADLPNSSYQAHGSNL